MTNGEGQLRDVVPTPDGGFIACGFAFTAIAADTMLYTQDVWVVKVDSMGCLEPGCHLIMGMETQITNLRDALLVSPNPVASGSTVQVQLDLPADFQSQGGLQLTVVSDDGRVVHQQPFTGTTAQLETDNWSSGLYHLHVSDATMPSAGGRRWISGAKLVVE